MSKKIENIVEKLAVPIIESEGMELVDVEYKKEGRDYFLYIYIDKPGGVGLDDCERISRRVEAELDEVDPIEQAYCLCVSSPGLDRPFRKDGDYKRALDSEIEVRLFAPLNGEKMFTGILKNFSDRELTLAQAGGTIVISRSDIAQARPYIKF